MLIFYTDLIINEYFRNKLCFFCYISIENEQYNVKIVI